MRLLILLSLIFVNKISQSQSYINEQKIRLPEFISDSAQPYEFSSLAQWKNSILLIPALKWSFNTYKIFAIEKDDIQQSIFDTNFALPVTNIFFDTLQFKEMFYSISGYDGIEATVVKGDCIYFSVEANPFCYIVEGIINDSGINTLKIILLKKIQVQKPAEADGNDGFESLAYLPFQNCLIAVFEKGLRAYKISSSLLDINVIDLPPFNKRISDTFAKNDNELVGVNSVYPCHYGNDCVQLIKLTLDIKKVNAIANIDGSCSCLNNWEGIIPFGKGVLMVTDNKYYNTTSSKLSYFEVSY